jgi:hypothetical protein
LFTLVGRPFLTGDAERLPKQKEKMQAIFSAGMVMQPRAATPARVDPAQRAA